MRQNYRTDDPETSEMAWESVKEHVANIRLRLLAEYEKARPLGLTDEEAGMNGQLGNGSWKRCSDLRRLGHIEPTGQTRPGTSGRQQRVCVITDAGRDFYYEWT